MNLATRTQPKRFVPATNHTTRVERVQARMIEEGISRLRVSFDEGFVSRVLILARDDKSIWGFFEGATMLCDDLEGALNTAYANNPVVSIWEMA